MLLAHLPLVVGGEGHHPCFAMPCSSIRNIARAVMRWYRRFSPRVCKRNRRDLFVLQGLQFRTSLIILNN